MSDKQQEALRLADALDPSNAAIFRVDAEKAATELRRLHAQRDELLEALKVLVSHVVEVAKIHGYSDSEIRAGKMFQAAYAAIAKAEASK